MDDDIFGASVWGSSSEPVFPPPSQPNFISTAQLDDFDDDFGSPTETAKPVGGDDDDFGDFGDFGDAEDNPPGPEFAESEGFGDEIPVAGPSFQTSWEPLNLDPLPSKVDLREQVDDILAPIWGNVDISQVTTKDGIREVEGVAQILMNPERYAISAAPPTVLSMFALAENFTRCLSSRHHPRNRQIGRVLAYADSI